MKSYSTNLSGLFLIEQDSFFDNRGSFTKIYNASVFEDFDIKINIREQFISFSNLNVLRGMHFQIPPYDHDKLVTCISGRVLDVVLDLRRDSRTFKKFQSFELNSNKQDSIFIPRGFAHGFISLDVNSGLLYSTSKVYNEDYDKGIRWDSFGFEWPCSEPIISDRDLLHPSFQEFENPF